MRSTIFNRGCYLCLWFVYEVNTSTILNCYKISIFASNLLDLASRRGEGSPNTDSVVVVDHGQDDHKTTESEYLLFEIIFSNQNHSRSTRFKDQGV